MITKPAPPPPSSSEESSSESEQETVQEAEEEQAEEQVEEQAEEEQAEEEQAEEEQAETHSQAQAQAQEDQAEQAGAEQEGQAADRGKKRARKSTTKRKVNTVAYSFTAAEEDALADWYEEHPILYKKRSKDFKNVPKKTRLYHDRGLLYDPVATGKYKMM